MPISARHIGFTEGGALDNKKFMVASLRHYFAINIIIAPWEYLRDFTIELLKQLYEKYPEHANKLIEIAQNEHMQSVLSALNKLLNEIDSGHNYDPCYPLRITILILHSLLHRKYNSLTLTFWKQLGIESTDCIKLLGDELLKVLPSLESHIKSEFANRLIEPIIEESGKVMNSP